MNTYCGKDCAACAQKEQAGCLGCKEGGTGGWPRQCPIAACCLRSGHNSCETCVRQVGCPTLRLRGQQPQGYLSQLRAAQEDRQRLRAQAAAMDRWLWPLFWLFLPGILAGILSLDVFAQAAPAVYWAGEVLAALCGLAYGAILLCLGPQNPRYRAAGVCALLVTALGISSVLAARWEAAVLLLSVAILPAGLIGEYCEYTAHSEVLLQADLSLSEKWRRLWVWYLCSLLAMFAGAFLLAVSPGLGVLLFIAAGIASVAVEIVKLVYLYRTAQVFRFLARDAQPPLL